MTDELTREGLNLADSTPREQPTVAGVRLIPLWATVLVGLAVWLIPAPAGVDTKAWRLLAIFVATVVGIITKPMPMGAVAMLGVAMAALTGTLTVNEALSGFGNRVIWLIVAAFFISRGFIKTGLGARIAYRFMAVLGRRTLGLAYGLVATDLVLAPVIPSNTARAGGVIYPFLKSVAKGYGSDPEDGTARKIGAFLVLTCFQGTVITSAMFMTAMAANPLCAQLAAEMEPPVVISWGDWALAACVPGVISLLAVPWLLYRLYPPEIKETPAAAQMAKDKLTEMGPMKRSEWLMFGTFLLLLFLWVFGGTLGVHSTTAALTGLCVLLLSGVLTWEDILTEKSAWNTLIWFSALVMMGTQLNRLGLIPWFGSFMSSAVAGLGRLTALLVLSLVYFYSHYFFASNTAHVSSMYAAFLAAAISPAVGAPPMLTVLLLAFFSNLFSSMTHYGTGPAPVLFGSGYVEMGTWWKLGALVSVVNIVIWLGIGSLWWKAIGLW